jgi:hypothetical protein
MAKNLTEIVEAAKAIFVRRGRLQSCSFRNR